VTDKKKLYRPPTPSSLLSATYLVLLAQRSVVRHDGAVVHGDIPVRLACAADCLQAGAAIVPPTVFRIAVRLSRGVAPVLHVPLGTAAGLHAGAVGVVHATGTMDQGAGDHIGQLGIDRCIRQLRTDDVVVICGVPKLVVRVQQYQDVGMRQAPLLEFDHVEEPDGDTQDMALGEVIHQGIELLLEYPDEMVGKEQRHRG
jgi:hypothetical protein